MVRGTKIRGIRVDEDVWGPAKRRADADGTDLSTVIRDALKAYGRGDACRWTKPKKGNRA